jgi:putative photosynthetic complex assembly protein 2
LKVADFGAPAAYAVLVWWFTTGVILFLDGLPKSTFRWSMAGASAVLLGAGYLVRVSALDPTSRGAYVAFTAAVLVWGWLEMSFLMGFVTGPRKHGCADRCSGWRHFVHAAQAIIYNEIAILIGGAAIFGATYLAPNRVALWTYAILWAMRLSAKLNLFFGVPNLGEKFLPPHLQYLRTFFHKRSMNFLFPLSISVATLVAGSLIQKYLGASTAFESTGYALVSSLLALAVLEHWFMVLPLPSERLWHWAMPQRSRSTPKARLSKPDLA